MTANDPEKEMAVNDDYLWDRSGTPDPEIERLESLLAEFRPSERPRTLPLDVSLSAPKPRGLLLQFPWLPRLAAAAVILLAAVISFFLPSMRVAAPPSGPSWDVANLEGAPQIGSWSIAPNQSAAKLYVGQTLTTNSSSRAALSEDHLGQIQVDPNSRVRLLQSGPNHKRPPPGRATPPPPLGGAPGRFGRHPPPLRPGLSWCPYPPHLPPR